MNNKALAVKELKKAITYYDSLCIEVSEERCYKHDCVLCYLKGGKITCVLSEVIDIFIKAKEINKRQVGSIREEAIKHGQNTSTVYARIKRGWTIQDALNVPVRGSHDE